MVPALALGRARHDERRRLLEPTPRPDSWRTARASARRRAAATSCARPRFVVHAERPILAALPQNDLHAFSERLDFQPQPHQQLSTLVWRMKWKD